MIFLMPTDVQKSHTLCSQQGSQGASVQLQMVLALPATHSQCQAVLHSQFSLSLRICVLVFDAQHRSFLLGTLHVLFALSRSVPAVMKLCSLEKSPLGLS